MQSLRAKKFFPIHIFQIECLIKNYTIRADRLRSLKGVNIGYATVMENYVQEKCVRLNPLSSPICGCHRTFANIRDTFIHTAAHTRLTRLERCTLQIVDSYLHFNNSSLPLSRRLYVLRVR